MNHEPLADMRRDFKRVASDTVRQASTYRIDPRRHGRPPRHGWNVASPRCRRSYVYVIAGKADRSCALMASVMLTALTAPTAHAAHAALGLAGVVMDGLIRDTEELRDLGFPLWAIGGNPNGPTRAATSGRRAP